VHLVVQLQNSWSEQNEILQASQNIRRLEAANEKSQHMSPSRSLPGVPISWTMKKCIL
jgi:hypothetical protein